MSNNRSQFISSINIDGIIEKDFLLNSFNEFKWTRPIKLYTLTYDDYMRPDLMSIRVYGDMSYWWILLKANPGLDDIYNDFAYDDVTENEYPNSYRIGSVIKCPHIQDIKDYIVYNKVKTNTLVPNFLGIANIKKSNNKN